jgi:hypothetical protein
MKKISLPTTGKIKLTSEARKLLEKALEAIVAYPQTLNMDRWLEHDIAVEPSDTIPNPYCGTTACIAGHITLAAGYTPTDHIHRDDLARKDPEALAILDGLYDRPEPDYDVEDVASALLFQKVRNTSLLARAGFSVPPIFYAFGVTPKTIVGMVSTWIRTGKVSKKFLERSGFSEPHA